MANLSDTVKQSAQKLPDPVAGVVNAVADSVKSSTGAKESDPSSPTPPTATTPPTASTTPPTTTDHAAAPAPVSRRLTVGCDFVHRSSFDVPAVFQVEPVADQLAEVVEAAWSMEPETPSRTYADLYGNPCRRLTIPAGRSVITYRATVDVPDAVEDVDEDAPERPGGPAAGRDADLHPAEPLLPAGRARPRGLEPVRHAAARLRRVQAICDYVHDHLTFSYGSSTPQSTAADVHASGYGVCRDYTHLAVSFCRALNIPARYVFGYLAEIEVPPLDVPMDFAAWMEVYLGDRWWTFDPRNNARRKGRVLIGRGRDAGDVAMATTFGAPFLESMTVIAEEIEPSEEIAIPA